MNKANMKSGATALICLGGVMLVIGTMTALTAPETQSRETEQTQKDAILRQSAVEILHYRQQEDESRPAPEDAVFIRGVGCKVYHWHRCPMLQELRDPKALQKVHWLTRKQAEQKQYAMCHYCGEVEKQRRRENSQ